MVCASRHIPGCIIGTAGLRSCRQLPPTHATRPIGVALTRRTAGAGGGGFREDAAMPRKKIGSCPGVARQRDRRDFEAAE